MSQLRRLYDDRGFDHASPIGLAKRLAGHWLQIAAEYSTHWYPGDPRAKDGALIRKRLDMDWPVTGSAARLLQIKHWLRTTPAMRDLIDQVLREHPYETKPDDYVRHVRDVIIDAINHDFPPTRSITQYLQGDIAEQPIQIAIREEMIMSSIAPVSTPILSTVTYVYGTDVKSMSEDQILAAVERIDADHARIAPLATTSKALAKRCEMLGEARKVLIDELDSREQ